MNTDPLQSVKPRFYDVCLMQELDCPALADIAEKAGLDKSVIEAMFISVMVHRVNAEKVLVALSQYTGKTWNFDNVRVALLPTFQDLYTAHNLDLAKLASDAGVPYATLDMMLVDQPIPVKEALLVLQMVSRLSGHEYTLENVDVKLAGGENTE